MVSPTESLQEPPLSPWGLNPMSLPAFQPLLLHAYPQPSWILMVPENCVLPLCSFTLLN